MSNMASPDRTLCTATYEAVQVAQSVIIRARGEHPTPGFKVVFEQSPLRIFPPEFVLRHTEPTGPVAKVITPFTVETRFGAVEPVRSVTVHDSTGRHAVLVEQVPVVATRTRSGGFIAVQETLTVYADGTLHFVNNRLDINQTQQVHDHQLRPLQHALAKPEWQTIKPQYGEPVADGIELSISGNNKSTTIHESPADIPAIVGEVLQHLETLWPSGGQAAAMSASGDGETELRPSGGGLAELRSSGGGNGESLRGQQPNQWEMRGAGVRATYEVTNMGQVLRYQDAQRNQTLRDEQIETRRSEIGTLLTIPLRLLPDPLALTQIERSTFTVVLPQITLNNGDASFETVAIQTDHRRGDGARQQYEVINLQGTARRAANNDLPAALFQHWVHARDEDTGDVDVYRPEGHPRLPAFRQVGFEIKRNGDFIQHDFGPADEPLQIEGRWTKTGSRQLQVELRNGRAFTLDIVELDDDLLKVRQVEVRQAADAALAAGD